MAAESNEKNHFLADTLAALLRHRIQAGPGVIEYINSIYGNPDIGEIQSLIDDQDSSERESLVELLLFPDEPVQARLEDVLQRHTYTAGNVAVVATDLIDRNITATVSLGDTGRKLHVRVDRTVLEPFLTRLHLDYSLDPQLNRTMADNLSQARWIAAAVRFRNARLEPSVRLRDFLQRYIRAMHNDPFFIEDLDFLLTFVQETHGDAELYDDMMRKKRKSWHHLNRFDAVEDRIRKSNVETLLAQGERVGYIDRRRTLKTIAAIDRICLAVYGKTEPVESEGSNGAGWEFRGAEDAAAMIRLLSS